MRPAFYDDPAYRKKQSDNTKRYFILNPHLKTIIVKACSNSLCNLPFQLKKPSDTKSYCTSRCAAIVNNSKRPKIIRFCPICPNQLKNKRSRYCSNKCQNTHVYNTYIERWKKGLEQGSKGINTRFLSGHIERYLKAKYKDKCSMCGWNQRNPITNGVPLEIDHIDGNSENNAEENLRLICPNCHSLTPYFRNLNKGRGRSWRIKYLKKLTLP